MEKSSSSPQYSWWWDSHHSPKHSQWLQSTLAELDRITKAMLTLIQEDGDSFAQRSEMYYKKKPELVKLIEEFHRSYRSLAERLDVLKFDSSVQTQSSSSSSSSKQSQNLQFPVKRSLQNSTSPELISNTTSPNSYPESVVEDPNLDGEYPKKLPEGLIVTKAEISNMNFIDDHPKQKTGTKKLEINPDPNLNSINNYQKQKCGTRKVEIDLKAVKKSANGLSATETADLNLNITDHHKKYKCGTRTLEIDPKTAKKTERGNPNSNFFDDCQKKKSEIRKVKANQNAAENPAVNEPDIVNWKIDCSESGDSLIEVVEVQCFLERENMWAELQSQVSKLIEDNMKQQAELITRNEEKKEAIKALSSQLNKLVDENRALHKRCLSISNKENPFRISRLKEIFLWKFCGQGSRV